MVASAGALAACGSSDDAPGSGASPTEHAGASPLEHVHGLGVNPSDDSLIIATHNGLFRVAEGQQRTERYGESQQDVMGFSALGPDRFIGSGHPTRRTPPCRRTWA